MSKFDNTNKVRKVLENTELSNESMDMILGCINELQDKINVETKVKLEAYVIVNDFKDCLGDQEALKVRIGDSEALIHDQAAVSKENADRIEL